MVGFRSKPASPSESTSRCLVLDCLQKTACQQRKSSGNTGAASSLCRGISHLVLVSRCDVPRHSTSSAERQLPLFSHKVIRPEVQS